MSRRVAVSGPPVFSSGAGFTPPSASDPHILPSHWKQMAACEACQRCGSNVFYPQIKYVGGFQIQPRGSQVGDHFLIFVLACLRSATRERGWDPRCRSELGVVFFLSFFFFLLQHNDSICH